MRQIKRCRKVIEPLERCVTKLWWWLGLGGECGEEKRTRERSSLRGEEKGHGGGG